MEVSHKYIPKENLCNSTNLVHSINCSVYKMKKEQCYRIQNDQDDTGIE